MGVTDHRVGAERAPKWSGNKIMNRNPSNIHIGAVVIYYPPKLPTQSESTLNILFTQFSFFRKFQFNTKNIGKTHLDEKPKTWRHYRKGNISVLL